MSTTENIVSISNGLIEWGTAESTSDNTQTFSLLQPYEDSPYAFVNRAKSGAKNILPVTETTTTSFSIDRNSDVDGTQPFNWMSIGRGEDNGSNSGVSPVMNGNEQVALLQWGTSSSRSDGSEYFPFNELFEQGCYAVIVQRMKSGSKSTLPVVEVENAGFKIDRDSGIDGVQDFFWVAVGDCKTTDDTYFEVSLGGDNALKGGLSTSDSDQAQSFNFADMGLADFGQECGCVLTNRTAKNAKDILAVTATLANGFEIDRNSNIDGSQSFYWLALGKN